MTLTDIVANWWVTNARIKHGHPPDATKATSPTPTVSQGLGTAAKVALGATGAAAAMLGAERLGLLPEWGAAPSDNPAATQPAETTAAYDPSQSLYQALEDGGYHLPPP